MSDVSSLRSRERGRPSRLPGETPGGNVRGAGRSLSVRRASRAFSSSPSRRVKDTRSPLRLPLQQRVPPVKLAQPQGPVLAPPGTAQFPQPVGATDQQLAAQVVQAQSQQISELVQLVKSLGELQAASLARGTVVPGVASVSSGEATVQPMEVDTGGVRHNKAGKLLAEDPPA